MSEREGTENEKPLQLDDEQLEELSGGSGETADDAAKRANIDTAFLRRLHHGISS